MLNAVGQVLETLLQGTSQILVGGYDGRRETFPEGEIDDQAIKRAILRDAGASESDYLDTWGVERYLKDTWSLAIDSRSVRGMPQGVREDEEE